LALALRPACTLFEKPKANREWAMERLLVATVHGGIVHAVAATEVSGRSADVPNLTSECTGSWPICSCCVLACASLEVAWSSRMLAVAQLFGPACFAAALGRFNALTLRHAARAQGKGRPGLA